MFGRRHWEEVEISEKKGSNLDCKQKYLKEMRVGRNVLEGYKKY